MTRIKSLIIFYVCLFAGMLFSADTAVLRFAPNDTIAVMETDLAGLMSVPEIAKLLNDESLVPASGLKSQTGIKPEDFKKLFIFVNPSGNTSVLLQFNPAIDLEKTLNQKNVKYSKAAVSGKVLLTISDQSGINKEIGVLQLAPGIMLAGSLADVNRYLTLSVGNLPQMTKAVAQLPADKKLIWLVYVNESGNAPENIPVQDVKQLYFTFGFSGKEKRQLKFELTLDTANKDSARMIAGLIPLYVPMGLGFVLGDAPELNAEVCKAVACRIEDNNRVVASLKISWELAQKVGKHLEKNFGGMAAGAIAEQMSGPAEKTPAPAKSK